MDLKELIGIMARLRDAKSGCPWDLIQTPETLKPYLIEETYEVVEAIDENDPEAIKGELGDLLFQIIFQARIQEERGNFNVEDVIKAISEKMRRRHPHIFGDAVARTPDDVKQRWEAIKREERENGYGAEGKSVLSGTPKSLPALLRARRIGKKAANVGFDWPDVAGAWDKIKEEIGELEEAISGKNDDMIKREFGDLLFAMVNVARHLNVNPEDALNETTDRFIRRFEYIEKALKNSDKKMEETPLEALDVLWEQAKNEVG